MLSRFRRNSPRRAGRRASGRLELGAAPRERRQRRRLPLRRLATVTLLLLAFGAAGYGASWLLLGDTLRVRDVTVVGAEIADPAAVAAAAALGGESLLTLDAGAAAGRVAALPGVREARVHRDWPRGVIIDIAEHQGWGYWQVGGVRRLIDIDGHPLDRARPPAEDAPTIIEVGPPAGPAASMRPDPDTVRLVDRLRREGAFELLRVRAQGFVFRRDRGLTVLIAGGPHAVLGDSHNYEFKLASWGALLDRIEEQRLAVHEIDLRFGRQLVMR